jgi:peptide methionine sulfoxide reductase MsrB
MSDTENTATNFIDISNVLMIPLPKPRFTVDSLQLFDGVNAEKAAAEINRIIVSVLKNAMTRKFDDTFYSFLYNGIITEMNKNKSFFSSVGAFDTETNWKIEEYCSNITNAFCKLYNTKHYDCNSNNIHFKDSDGYEYWYNSK